MLLAHRANMSICYRAALRSSFSFAVGLPSHGDFSLDEHLCGGRFGLVQDIDGEELFGSNEFSGYFARNWTDAHCASFIRAHLSPRRSMRPCSS